MRGWCKVIAVVVGLGCGSLGATPLSEQQRLELDAIVDGVVANASLASMVVMIDQGGETVYERAVGLADLSNQVPTKASTAYGIGSITKSFTGLAIALLVEQGKVELDAPVSRYLPEYEGPGASATVSHLLTHTSGIPSYNTEIPEISFQLERNAFTREDMVDFFDDLPLNFEPGERFSYSNSGYYLLGLIIEAVSGASYYEFLEEEIFTPLNMHRTYAGVWEEVIPNMARGYGVGEEGAINAAPWHHLVPFSAGSLVSTAEDVIRYRRGVALSPRIPDAVKEGVLEVLPLNDGTPNIYSVGGLIVSDFEGQQKISHAGDIWGYASNHAYYPEQDVTIVQLTNQQLDAPAMSSVEAKLARVVLGLEAPVTRDLELAENVLARYEGDYEMRPYTIGFDRIGFVAKDGKLSLLFGGLDSPAPPVPLLAQGDGLFRVSFDDEWTFQFDNNGDKPIVSKYRDGTFFAYPLD